MKMRHTGFAALALLGSFAVLADAQHCGMNMPDMPVPNSPASQHSAQQNGKSKTPGPLQMPQDMKPGPSTNPHALAADRSVQQSEQQQRAQQNEKPGPGSDAQSVTHDTYVQQEFEAPGIHSGNQPPAPELLGTLGSQPVLTLPMLEGWADTSNPTLLQARALVRRSEAQARQVGLPPDPTVGYSGEHIRGGSYGGGENGAFVQQTVVLGGKLASRKNIYQQQAEAGKLELEKQTDRVHNDVEQAFYAALAAQEQVGVHRQMLGVALNQASTAHELANVGQQDAPEVLEAELATEQAKVDFAHAQRMYIEKFAELVSVAGKPGTPLAALAGDLEHVPELDTGALVGEIVGDSPSVRQSQREVSVAEARLKDAHRESVPDLKLQAGAWWSGEQLNGTTKPAGWMGFGSAGVDLPLWNRNQGNVEAARAEVDRAKGDVTRTQLMMKRRAEPLAQRYMEARYRAERYREGMLPRAQRAYELYRMKYEQMAAAFPQVLMSEQTWLQLRIAYIEALDEVWRDAIALRNYTLEGGLDAPQTQAPNDTALNLPSGGDK